MRADLFSERAPVIVFHAFTFQIFQTLGVYVCWRLREVEKISWDTSEEEGSRIVRVERKII